MSDTTIRTGFNWSFSGSTQQLSADGEPSNGLGLGTIREVSRETSGTNLTATNNLTRRTSTWWNWNEQEEYHESTQQQDHEQLQPLSMDSETDGSFWTPTYRRMSSVVSYVYRTELVLEPVITEGNVQPLEGPISAKEENNSGSNEVTWYTWIWNGFGTSQNDTEPPNAHEELLRSAKAAIEANKDSLHYAFKNNRTHHNSAYGELAVASTKTEEHPVRYKYKKVPLLPNQIQESNLTATTNNSTTTIAANTGSTLNSTVAPTANTSTNPTTTSITTQSSPQLVQLKSFKLPSPIPPNIPKVSSSASSIKSQRSILSTYRNNLVTPDIDENFRPITLKTKLRLIGEHLLFQDETSEAHLYKHNMENISLKKTKRIKKIVIIGVHGFFPFKMVKTLIGEPTGSSMRFTNEATKAIYKWLETNEEVHKELGEVGEEEEIDIETISLEGKGKIENRVENLYKLLLNWIEVINNCDFLFMIGHSQGSAVAIHLLAKLIENHHVKTIQKIGLLSMSGILQGPFPGLDSKIVIRAYSSTENEILNELFEFLKSNSYQSIKLAQSIQILVENNVKITLTGSINDQLIPMYSSLGLNINHPNIFRCINVNENCEYPNFVVVLLKILLLLINLGHGDHGLFGELSKICMGTVSKGGHSRIYSNNDIYLISIKHALETTNLHHSQPLYGYNRRKLSNEISLDGTAGTVPPPPTDNTSNLYNIPFYVHELIQDLIHTKHLSNIKLVQELLYEYKNWEPTQKHWKDLKYCLEALNEFDIEEFF